MTPDETRQQAARERSRKVAARADRPSQRRCAEIVGAPPVIRSKAALEMRAADGDTGTVDFHGVASAYEAPYEMWDCFGPYTEIVSAGAGSASLANPELDVPLVLQHQPLRRMARTTNGSLILAEGDTDDGGQGLLVDAPGLDLRDADVAYITPKIQAGLIDEMSFAFSITSGQWSPDYMEYRINSYDIHRGDVAIVGYGANPATSAQLRSITSKLQEKRALDPEDVSIITQALGWFSAVDNIVDEAQETLADYLKIPNPDSDELAQELAAVGVEQLRHVERAIRRELSHRKVAPTLTLADLVALAD